MSHNRIKPKRRTNKKKMKNLRTKVIGPFPLSNVFSTLLNKPKIRYSDVGGNFASFQGEPKSELNEDYQESAVQQPPAQQTESVYGKALSQQDRYHQGFNDSQNNLCFLASDDGGADVFNSEIDTEEFDFVLADLTKGRYQPEEGSAYA